VLETPPSKAEERRGGKLSPGTDNSGRERRDLEIYGGRAVDQRGEEFDLGKNLAKRAAIAARRNTCLAKARTQQERNKSAAQKDEC